MNTYLGAAAAALGGYVVQDQVGFLLRRAQQRHTGLFQDLMADLDLTPTQFTALVKTVELGHVTQNHLGRLTAMDPATIQGVVRRLAERGLVARDDDPMDKRTIVLTPTADGIALAGKAASRGREITAQTLLPLSHDEQAAVLALLRKLG